MFNQAFLLIIFTAVSFISKVIYEKYLLHKIVPDDFSLKPCCRRHFSRIILKEKSYLVVSLTKRPIISSVDS